MTLPKEPFAAFWRRWEGTIKANERTRELYSQDPMRGKRISQNVVEYQRTTKARQDKSEMAIKQWQDKSYSDNVLAALANVRNDPEFRKRKSEEIRLRNIENWSNPSYREQMSAQWTDERRNVYSQRMTERNLENWQDLEYRNHIVPLLSKNLASIKVNHPTWIESLGRESLTKRRYDFENEYIIDICRADHAIPDHKIAIFADGCYYHGCLDSNCSKGRQNIKAGDYIVRHCKLPISLIRAKDLLVNKFLITNNWTVVRIWEHEYLNDHDIVGVKIDSILGDNS